MMDLKFATVCLVIFATVNAGFLNLGQNNGGNGDNGGGSSGGTFAFHQQVPLALNPGPVAQSSQSQQAGPHASASISTSFVSPQNQGSSSQNPIASSSTYRQQHVNSVPATITTHGVATSYVAVPAHGFFNDNGGNNIVEGANTVAPGNNNGGLSAGYGYGSYGYTFSAAGGNSGSSGRNQGNNGGGASYGYGGNGGPSSVAGFSV